MRPPAAIQTPLLWPPKASPTTVEKQVLQKLCVPLPHRARARSSKGSRQKVHKTFAGETARNSSSTSIFSNAATASALALDKSVIADPGTAAAKHVIINAWKRSRCTSRTCSVLFHLRCDCAGATADLSPCTCSAESSSNRLDSPGRSSSWFHPHTTFGIAAYLAHHVKVGVRVGFAVLNAEYAANVDCRK